MNLRNIALIGARGAGKSKIARKLAKCSNRALMSLDQLISYENNGESINNLVEKAGWSGFRDLEFATLKKVCALRNVIVDCGGGILVEAPVDDFAPETFSDRKAELLKSSAEVIYIKRDWDWMIMKADINSSRPDLGGSYKELLTRRLPWYESCADFILDLQNKRNINLAIEQIMNKYFPEL